MQNTLVVFKWWQWEIIPLSSRGVWTTYCGHRSPVSAFFYLVRVGLAGNEKQPFSTDGN